MEQCGSQFADWWASFLKEENVYDMNSVFNILPTFDNRDKYAQLFLKGFSNRIVSIPCIPTLRDGEYKLVKLEEVLFDKIGFIACENPVLTDEELYEFFNTTACVPHPSVRCNVNLKRLLEYFDCSVLFGDNDLTQLCLKNDFQKWLAQFDHDYLFLGYLLDSDYIMNYWEYAIFLTDDGRIDKAAKLYYDLDNFVEDISFLDLPRLDVTLRDKLSANYNTWDSNKSRFKLFNDHKFIKKIFDNFSNYKVFFSTMENSIHFIHFLSVTGSLLSIPSDYPFFMEDGNPVSSSKDVYQKNDVGMELSSHSWIDKNWIKFLNEQYYVQDEEKVRSYLSSKCKIKELTKSDCYQLFISNNDRVPLIADKIKEKVTSIDFYYYLLSIQDVINNMTPLMRQNYCILATDGETELWAPITKTIFWQDAEWEDMSKTAWMPKQCCLAVNNCYFKGLTEDEKAQLKILFSTKQIIQKFSISGLYQSLRTRLDDVFAMITSREISKDFLNFLFKYRTEIFKNEQIDVAFKKIPISCKDSDAMAPINKFEGRLYNLSNDALKLYNQPWFNRSLITLCDDFYFDLFDGSERCNFFEYLGIKVFSKIDYLRTYLLNHLDQFKKNIKDRENNIAFHRYIADVHDELSDKDLENVKGMPIFISSPNIEGGVLAEVSNDHYLPSELLSDIISKDLVPISILHSIHPDYVLVDKDRNYFIDKLDNVEIDEEGFISYIIKDRNKPNVITYLKNKDRNVKFWRWVCDSKQPKKNKAKLNIFPMLFRSDEGVEEDYDEPKNLFISDLFSGVDGLEKFISENVKSPKFVSSAYWEEGVERDWSSLLKTLGVTVDYEEIVFKNVLPNLARYKDMKVVNILAKYVDTFNHKLFDKDETIIGYLNNLYLKCNDGKFRTPKEVYVSGKFFDIEENSFLDIEIKNLVSEDYITNTDDVQRRNVIKFIVLIADFYKVKLENETQLQKRKLCYFSENQEDYAQTEAHYKIIGELAELYEIDHVGVSKILCSQAHIKLYTTTERFIYASELYLSTTYMPKCQYMAKGITELNFVSEKYAEYCEGSKLKKLFNCLRVLDDFREHNLKLLNNYTFASYFWKDYAQDKEQSLKNIITEDKLKDIACIPTSLGMKKPMEVYDYRNPQLQKIVLKLKGGKDKLPVVKLPDWVGSIGLRGKLYILDCLEYLSLDKLDFRRDVMNWLIETPSKILQLHKQALEKYCESANWYNGAKYWVPLSTLVALEWKNNTLIDNFGGNAYVCNPSYMPESKDSFIKLCSILNIKILTNNDFIKQKEGDCQKDSEAIREISKRLLYIAYKSGKENWEEIYDGYKERLDRADISRCERIIYSYNENIVTDMQIYSEEATKLWYVNSWQGPMFLGILDWILTKLDVKDIFDRNLLLTLFLSPFVKFIKHNEGGTLPTELLDYLDETEREDIGVDESLNPESFTENYNDVNSLPEGIRQSVDLGIEQGQDVFSHEDDERESESDSLSYEEGQLVTEKKCGSDFGGTHHNDESSSNNGDLSDELHPTKIVDNRNESDRKKPLTVRLQEKWNRQKNAQVQKPHSVKQTPSNLSVFGQQSTSIENAREFFEKDVSTDKYTSGRSGSDWCNRNNISKKQKLAQKELDKATDQVSLNDAINRTPKYTFLWFKYVMEQLYNQKKDTATTRSVQIDFREAKLLGNNTVSILKPNRVIPTWLEHADDISLHILSGDSSEKIEIDLQYYTDDAIWIYYVDNTSKIERM